MHTRTAKDSESIHGCSLPVPRRRVVPVTRHPLGRSAAFTALLHYAPWLARTEAREAGAVVSRFLEGFYCSGSKDVAAYAAPASRDCRSRSRTDPGRR
jgi:hypothetical protein